MKPPPDATKITNELRGASAFFRAREPEESETTNQPTDQSTGQSTEPATNRPATQVIAQPGEQPIDQSTHLPNSEEMVPASRQIVSRPKAFYITEEIDQRLDAAVRYLQDHHHIRKVDRSVLLNAMLSDSSLWSDQALDSMVDRVVDQLTSRLTGRL